jgi:hypothetical protein
MAKIKLAKTGTTTKPKVTRSLKVAPTPRRTKDPMWTGCETWDADKFNKFFRECMSHYNLTYSGKDLKPNVMKWMAQHGYTKSQIESFKASDDWRCQVTMGAIASCLLQGMPEVREDFNNGKNSADWLRERIEPLIVDGQSQKQINKREEALKSAQPKVTIQDRIREQAGAMCEDIDYAIDAFITDPDSFDPKALDVLNLLRQKDAKAPQARYIASFYIKTQEDLAELASGKADSQLIEAYSHLPKKHVRKLIEFYKEISDACAMLSQEQKVNRKPRIKKAPSKEKMIAKVKYCKSDEKLKLVSINPIDLIGSKELWIYNTKTRKLGKYVAADYRELAVKGTSIINFDENKSVCKTLRKPADQLKEFKSAGKVALRKFLEDINAVDTKMNGRLNEDIILLKVN